MELHLTPQQEAFIQRGVRSGRFASENAALREAVELLEVQDRLLEKLGTAVDEGDQDIAQARYTEYTDETLPQLAEELKLEARTLRNNNEASMPR